MHASNVEQFMCSLSCFLEYSYSVFAFTVDFFLDWGNYSNNFPRFLL